VRFDWYAATIQDDPLYVVSGLINELGGSAVVVNPKQGYTSAQAIEVDGSRIATVFYGGRNGNPHAYASGEHSDAFAAAVRRLWPLEHRVTRMDVAQDFDEPGVFDRLLAIARDVRDERGIAYSLAGAWDHNGESLAGRTFYLGSTKSAVRVRLYEKGKELMTHELPEGVEPSLDLTRLEVQVRPEQDSRYVAAQGAPVDAWGYAVWARDLLHRVMGLDVQRVTIKQPRRSDQDRALQAMAEQYARHIAAYSDELGTPDAFGVEIVRRARVYLAKREDAA
jgi:hypothetical protein